MTVEFAELEAVAAETWAAVRGVACDLDDTLTEGGRIGTVALGALEALARAGVPCVVATGRPVGWAEVLATVLPVRAVVAENGGAWVLREEHGVRVAFLEDEATRARGMERARAMAEVLLERYPALGRVREFVVRATDVTMEVGAARAVPRAVREEALEQVRRAGLYAVASTVHLHVSARAPDKMAGLRAVVAELGLDPGELGARWVYVGDSPNDAGPFGAMALSVGVAGVRAFGMEEMPAWPRYVTAGGAGAGFAEVVERVLRHRGRG